MNSDNINWDAYNQGHAAWDRYCDSGWVNQANNPYEKGSAEWHSWNRGWNTNGKGIN